jgi:hypothetical protein
LFEKYLLTEWFGPRNTELWLLDEQRLSKRLSRCFSQQCWCFPHRARPDITIMHKTFDFFTPNKVYSTHGFTHNTELETDAVSIDLLDDKTHDNILSETTYLIEGVLAHYLGATVRVKWHLGFSLRRAFFRGEPLPI